MTEQLPEFRSDENVMLNVDKAHKALERINDEIDEAVKEATERINGQYTPIMFAAQSVLYEAMGKAAEAGFTYTQMRVAMDCDSH